MLQTGQAVAALPSPRWNAGTAALAAKASSMMGTLLTRLLCRPCLLLLRKCARGLAMWHTAIRAAGRNAAAGTGAPAVGPGRQAAFRRLQGCLTPCAWGHRSHAGLLQCRAIRLAAKHAQRRWPKGRAGSGSRPGTLSLILAERAAHAGHAAAGRHSNWQRRRQPLSERPNRGRGRRCASSSRGRCCGSRPRSCCTGCCTHRCADCGCSGGACR